MNDRAPEARWMRLRIAGGMEGDRERALVVGCEAGAGGAEELDGPPPALLLFATQNLMPAVQRAITAACPQVSVGMPEILEEVEWSEAWKEGLEPLVVGDRLVIRPSFWTGAVPKAEVTLVLDPGQAFGTGNHGSTLLALEWLCDLPRDRLDGASVLDVGCGTGVLALAALGLGADAALALDLDPLATEATCRNAEVNRAEGLEIYLGPLADAPGDGFDVVVANMIRSELFPVLPTMANRVRPGGLLVLSGLLRSEQERTRDLLLSLGLAWEGSKEMRDDLGDHWMSVLAARNG